MATRNLHDMRDDDTREMARLLSALPPVVKLGLLILMKALMLTREAAHLPPREQVRRRLLILEDACPFTLRRERGLARRGALRHGDLGLDDLGIPAAWVLDGDVEALKAAQLELARRAAA